MNLEQLDLRSFYQLLPTHTPCKYLALYYFIGGTISDINRSGKFSGNLDSGSLEKYKRLGVQHLIDKPFEIEDGSIRGAISVKKIDEIIKVFPIKITHNLRNLMKNSEVIKRQFLPSPMDIKKTRSKNMFQ